MKSVFGLRRRGRIAYESIPWRASCDPKLKEKTTTLKNTCFLHQICKQIKTIAPGRCPNGCQYFRGGASWGTFGAPVCFLTRKMHPKCSKSDPKGANVTPKGCQSDQNVSKMVRNSGHKACNNKNKQCTHLAHNCGGC